MMRTVAVLVAIILSGSTLTACSMGSDGPPCLRGHDETHWEMTYGYGLVHLGSGMHLTPVDEYVCDQYASPSASPTP